MIKIRVSGNYGKAKKYFSALQDISNRIALSKYGEMGVEALRNATPKKSGRTADSWNYVIQKTDYGMTIQWINNNVNDNVNIAIIIQYGHGTKNGAYVQGIDYINPALEPIFTDMANDIWKEVTRL